MKKVTSSQLMFKKNSWTDLFDSEQELTQKMMEVKIEKGLTVPKGYLYIEGFQKYYQEHGTLTSSQMTQLKRLAKGIYAYANNLNIGGILVMYK